jgi:hypothetical protein
MAVEVEIDPLVRASTLGATEHSPVKIARGGEVVDREGEVERR